MSVHHSVVGQCYGSSERMMPNRYTFAQRSVTVHHMATATTGPRLRRGANGYVSLQAIADWASNTATKEILDEQRERFDARKAELRAQLREELGITKKSTA